MINRTPEKKEKMLAPFYLLQTHSITLRNNQKAAGAQTTTLIPDMLKLIGLCLLTPAKLEPLSALVIFLQQDKAFNTHKIRQINYTLKKAISTNNFTSEYVDPIYNPTFTRIIELIDNRKEELLRKAAKAGNELAVVQLLKIDGIDINAKDNNGWSALMFAAKYRSTSVVTQLLNVNEILVNAESNAGMTALMWAASDRHTSVVTQLLKVKDIAVNAKSKDGMTALMFAANDGHTPVVTPLLNVDGILVNTKNNDDQTALMFAAQSGHTSVVAQLVTVKDIEINTKNNDGYTALMLAAAYGHTSVVYQLCAKQLFDAPYGQGNELFKQLINEVKSVSSSITINPESLYAYFLECVDALPTTDEKIALLEKALSKSNAFSALMTTELLSHIQQAIEMLQISINTQPVIFSAAPVASSSASNTANTSPRLISNQ